MKALLLALALLTSAAALAGHAPVLKVGPDELTPKNAHHHAAQEVFDESEKSLSESIEVASGARLCFEGQADDVARKIIGELRHAKHVQASADGGALTVSDDQHDIRIPACK